MTSFENISKIFQGVITLFQCPDGLRRCEENEKVQEEIVHYLLTLGSLFGVLSESSNQLKVDYSQALVDPVIGYHSQAISRAIWNAFWEMDGVNSILTSLQVDLCQALVQSSEKFENLNSFTSWLVHFLEKYTFKDKVKEEFGDRCLLGLERIRERLISIIRASSVNDLKTACEENWI